MPVRTNASDALVFTYRRVITSRVPASSTSRIPLPVKMAAVAPGSGWPMAPATSGPATMARPNISRRTRGMLGSFE